LPAGPARKSSGSCGRNGTKVPGTKVPRTEVPGTEADEIVFDTNWIINFVKGKVDGQRFEGTGRFISVITRIELYGFPGISPKERGDITRFLEKVTEFPLTDEVVQRAIEVRRRFHLKTPDAIIAATALELGVTLVTGDGPLAKKKIPGLLVTVVPFPSTENLPGSPASWRSVFLRNKPLWIAIACLSISTLVFAILFILK
jgi:predicted nucleic acid-binding protein